MAIPTMLNNFPSAGYIAWGNFSIQLYGQVYSIPAASSNQRWVWWVFNNGAPAIVGGPEVPQTLGPDDLVLFANKNGVAVRVQSSTFVDGELIVDGSILTDAIAANQIVTEHMAVGSINGDRIQAKTITSDKVIVGDGDERLLKEAMEAYVQSRALNLVTNGSGLLGDTTNWPPGSVIDKTDVPTGASASYQMPPGATQRMMSELLPVDPNRIYELSAMLRQTAGAGYFYLYFAPHDRYELQILPQHYMAIPDTLTTLAAPLKAGDTKMTLTNAANWYGTAANPAGANSHWRQAIFWDYTDPGGKLWPELTYSRNVTEADTWLDGAVSGNVITLRVPYTGPTKPAGTKVSNGSAGGTYMYLGAVNVPGTSTWTQHRGQTEPGAHPSGTNMQATTRFPMMTTNVRVGFLVNYTTGDPASRQSLANVSVTDITRAVEAQNRAEAAYSRWAPANQTTIDGGKITADTITGNQILGQTIGVEKLVVGDLANMAEINESRAIGRLYETVQHRITDGWSTRSTNASQYFMFRTQHGPLPFKTGDRIRVAFEAYANVAAPCALILWLYGDANPVQLIGSPSITPTAQSFAFEFDVTPATAGKTSFLIGLEGVSGKNVFVRNARIYRMGAGELIVDGSVHAKKIQAKTITANEIAVGTITASEIATNTITAEQLDVENVVAEVIQTGALQSQLSITGVLEIDGTDQRWTADGLQIGQKVRLYPDERPNLIEADLVTSNVTVKDGLSIGGSADIHGDVVVANGITAPTARMALGQTWPKKSTILNNGDSDISNLYFDMVEYNTDVWLVPYGYYGAGTGLRLIIKTDGTWGGDLTLGSWASTFYPIGGIAKYGTSLYLLGTDSARGGDYYLYRLTSTGTINKTSELKLGGPNLFNGKRPRIFSTEAHVCMVWTSYNGDLNYRRYLPDLTGKYSDDIRLATGVGLANVGAVYYGYASPGEQNRMFVSMQQGDNNVIRVYTSGGSPLVGENFPRAANSTVVGMAYDSRPSVSRLATYDKFGYLSVYSRLVGNAVLRAQYTYYDGDNGNYPAGTIINGTDKSGQASGPHETAPSPVDTFVMSKRAWPVVLAPPAPDELVTDVLQVDKANRLGVYASIDNATTRLQAYLPVGIREIPVTDQYNTTSVAAGASGVPSFASAAVPAPGRFRSAAMTNGQPTVEVLGSGAGRAGPYRWDAKGQPMNHGGFVSTVAQSIPNGAWTVTTGWGPYTDFPAPSGVTYNNATGTFTVAQSGLWMVTAAATLSSTSGTSVRRLVGIFQNGTLRLRQELASTAAGQVVTPVASGVLYLNAGDVITVNVYHNGGTGVTKTTDADTNSFTLVCLAGF